MGRRKKEGGEERKSSIKRKKPQRPIFTSPCRLTIVSAVTFHCQVRDGSGWVRYALATTLFSFIRSTLSSTSKNEYRNGCFQLARSFRFWLLYWSFYCKLLYVLFSGCFWRTLLLVTSFPALSLAIFLSFSRRLY